ncbi:MAG: pseudouridine synthase [Mariprofundaceae bacterium]|nr:pseudouridine synthase [Mariprofundaceae bacterium]
MNDPLLTRMPVAAEPHELPARFPSPFAYSPHPLAEQAAQMLQQRLKTERLEDGRSLLTANSGKMFGVLVVKDSDGELGFLSAFSGMMSGHWDLPGFVPPLCDQVFLNQFYPEGAEVLAQFTQQLKKLEQDPQRLALSQAVSAVEQQRHLAILTMKAQHKEAKKQRQLKREALQLLDDPELQQRTMAVLASTSKRHDREATDIKRAWRNKLRHVKQHVDSYEQQMKQVKDQRSEKSRQLVRLVFKAYQLHNFLGERKPMGDFFLDGLPPSGSGDCAAPKMIHYASIHQLQPIALAEFWWGESPSTGIRHHGHYYPSCRGKCRPILPFMLGGLEVDPEPIYIEQVAEDEPKLVYEDEHMLLINKPAGLLSVPGNVSEDSVFNRLLKRYPDCPELRLVHRLDMSTSGLILVAKNLRINKLLQKQFMDRTVEKRYEALLDGLLPPMPEQGEVNLPMRGDLDDRPRQMVCHEHGKPSRTYWQRLGSENGFTRVFFYPQTGRTHQLRIHASHRDGLNIPIVGDDLYGRIAERMMLHAQRLCFLHPLSREPMTFEAPTPF